MHDSQDKNCPTVSEVKGRIEVLHGNVLAQRASKTPAVDTHETVKAAFLAGRIAGLHSALKAFEKNPVADRPTDACEAYRQLSEQFQEVGEVCTVENQRDQRSGGFE